MATRNTQSIWAEKEIFMILPKFMDPSITEEQLTQLHKQMSSWMCFAKDDTLLFTYLEACTKRLFTLSKDNQKTAAKNILAVAKNYKSSKEYLSLLYLAKDLYQDE